MKVKFLISIVFFFLAGSVVAQSAATEAYVRQYKNLAIAEMQRTGVPAAIKLAQAILESQSGSSSLAMTANNHFGIKCKTEWTGSRVFQDDDEKGECFRVYPSVEQSYRDHSDFLRNRPYYADLFKLDPLDTKGWAWGLKKAGYATNPAYPQRLLSIIRDYNLEQYNEAIVIGRRPAASDGKQDVSLVQQKEPETEENDVLFHRNSIFPRGIFHINRSRVVFALAGTNLNDLLRQYDVTSEDLMNFNELSELKTLTESRLIFIEKKLKKSNKIFRIAQQGETWKDISQFEGVRLDYLLIYNEVTQAETIIPAGQKIRLQPLSDINGKWSGTH
jgi:hypothetical protein